MEDQDRTGR